MSLWQFGCCVEGWNKSQGGEQPLEPMSAEEYDEAMLDAARRANRLH